MRLPTFTFRILLPIIYLISMILPAIGMVLTIAEGPNPFGFLIFASAPGFYLFRIIDHLVPMPRGNIVVTLLVGMLLNIGIYFAVGWLIDDAIKRRRRRKLAAAAQAASNKSLDASGGS